MITGHDDCVITGASFHTVALFSICVRVQLISVFFHSSTFSYSIKQSTLRASVANTLFLVQFENDNIIFDNILHSGNNNNNSSNNQNSAILWWSCKCKQKDEARTNLSFFNMTTSRTCAPNYAMCLRNMYLDDF